VHNTLQSEGSFEDINTQNIQTGAARYPNSDWTSMAAYFNHEWEWSSELTSQLGVRYNHILIESDFSNNQAFYPLPFSQASLSTGNVTGSAGFVYRPSEEWKWRVNIGTAFRAPNVDDIGKVFDSGDNVVVVPNRNLRAEYAYNFEMGLATIQWQRLKLDGSIYFTLLNQALIRRPFVLNGQDSILYDGELSQVQAVQNAASAQVYGVQVGLDWQISENWSFGSRYNWQNGEEEDQSGQLGPSRHAAPAFGISRIRYKRENMLFELNLQYAGEISADQLNFEEAQKPHLYLEDGNGQLFSPSLQSLNFKSSVSLNDHWTLSGGIENILDQRYRPYSSGLVAAGRNFVLAARFSF